jgi:2-dehydro-3-deoxygalactonokinase
MEEVCCPVGIKDLYVKCQKEGLDRAYVLLGFLKAQIGRLQTTIPDNIEIVISGMASSSIGIHELPYSGLPFWINGKGLHVGRFIHALFPFGYKMISGVCSDSDVMRGEEVQLVGLARKAHVLNERNIFILPGTHSKHLICENGKIVDFNTYMTGELFQVVAEHTLLSDSIEKQPISSGLFTDFDEGVLRNNGRHSLMNDLFKIRAADLLGSRLPKQNFFYLSGLLIGEELSSLRSLSFDRLILCAGENLAEFYIRALQILGFIDKTKILDKGDVEHSVVEGQMIIMQHQKASI